MNCVSASTPWCEPRARCVLGGLIVRELLEPLVEGFRCDQRARPKFLRTEAFTANFRVEFGASCACFFGTSSRNRRGACDAALVRSRACRLRLTACHRLLRLKGAARADGHREPWLWFRTEFRTLAAKLMSRDFRPSRSAFLATANRKEQVAVWRRGLDFGRTENPKLRCRLSHRPCCWGSCLPRYMHLCRS